jgi:hypothetical protein
MLLKSHTFVTLRMHNKTLPCYVAAINVIFPEAYIFRPSNSSTAGHVNVQLDKEFLRTVTIPISRGGSYGIVGNSRRVVEANSLLIESKTLGRLPHGWRDRLSQCVPTSDTDDVVHYRCPVCEKAVLC